MKDIYLIPTMKQSIVILTIVLSLIVGYSYVMPFNDTNLNQEKVDIDKDGCNLTIEPNQELNENFIQISIFDYTNGKQTGYIIAGDKDRSDRNATQLNIKFNITSVVQITGMDRKQRKNEIEFSNAFEFDCETASEEPYNITKS